MMKKLSEFVTALVLCVSFVLVTGGSAKAADSSYPVSFESLWNNESYIVQDNVNTKMGKDYNMCFPGFVQVGDTYYNYFIGGDSFGVAMTKTTDGVNFSTPVRVLSPDPGVSYESFPGAFYEDGTFYLYTESSANGYSITLATSTDGINFTKQGTLLTATAGTWDSGGIGTPNLVRKGSTYYLFYHGFNTTTNQMYTGVATAPSPSGPFTKYSGNPVLPAGPAGSYDEGTAGRRGIILEDGVYYMAYEASTAASGYADFSTAYWTVALAKSTDLLNWQKLSQNPVIPSKYSYGNDGPTLVDILGTKWIYYRDDNNPYGNDNYAKRARLANETSGPGIGYDVIYEAESMTHDIGSAVPDGWQALQGSHSAGYMISGPDRTGLVGGENLAIFKAKITDNSFDNAKVMRIEVYDSTISSLIASREITRQQFVQTDHYEFFTLPYVSTEGHTLKFRVYWYGNADITYDRILVKNGDPDPHAALVRDNERLELSDNFDDNNLGTVWTTFNGVWSETNQVLRQTSTALGDPKKALISNSGIPFPSNIEVTAKVRVDSWTDGGYARAGVSIANNTVDGNGYNLIFYNDHHTVAFLDDGVAFGPSYTFNWSNDTWYWFKLKNYNGTLYGKVWEDGKQEPSYYPYQWTHNTRTGGYPGLNGGSSGASGNSTVSFDDVSVHDRRGIYETEDSSYHQIGRKDLEGWSANVGQDNDGYLLYGPYATDIPTGNRTAVFRMLIDNHTFDNNNVVHLDVYDATESTVLASRTVTRQEFAAANEFQDFSLDFVNATAGHRLEFRIYWYKSAYIRSDKVIIN
ncbi:family 43 glycosylhydrolase [Paenibacillaceae bacterium WGS1546]|uniref:family 43 glycosylhydrolase n=1 Tax=Cohnella sp. WGS1546 TaxID=3366810 RepID=UPI00372D1A68